MQNKEGFMRVKFWLLVLLFVCACSGSGEGDRKTGTQTVAEKAKPAEPVVVELAERNVSCGCAIESIGTCGNYIEIDGNYVAIGNSEEVGLDGMEWCGKKGVRAQSAGELRGGVFYATTLAAHTQ
jgi:hypothetical protein